MFRRNLALIITLSLPLSILAADLSHSVSGDDEIESTLESATTPSNSPFIVEGEPSEDVASSKIKDEDPVFNHGVKEVSVEKLTAKRKYEDFGYTTPGSFDGQENYIDLDKNIMVKDLRKNSTGGINLSFIKNDFSYGSTNDIINRTISTGSKSLKGGALFVRNDSYLLRTDFLNLHWSIGSGVSFSRGRGIFVDGNRSDAVFSFWEVPVDAGLGAEIPISSWFIAAGTAGPSVLGLMQNRSDFERGEKGKRKFQYSPGYFASAQFKVNLSGFNADQAYNIFTTSDVTNLFMNVEIRHHNYSSFKDEIQVSGTSFGLGFTFEYL